VTHLRVLEGSIANILTEFYSVKYDTFFLLDEEGNDYVDLKSIYEAMKTQQPSLLSTQNKVVEWKRLVPDLLGNDFKGFHHIEKGELTMKRVLGKGAYGEVWLADWMKKNGEKMEVAVKMWLDKRGGGGREKEIQKEKEGEDEEDRGEEKGFSEEEFKAMKMWIDELMLLSLLLHPNLMRMYGVCREQQPPWIVLQLMKGGCLNDIITDPLGLVALLEVFEDLFGMGDAATVHKVAEVKGKMREYEIDVGEGEKKEKKSLDGPLSRLTQCVEKLSLPLDKALFGLYVKGYEDHWDLRTKDSHKTRCEVKQKV
jgi:hypothetical protein